MYNRTSNNRTNNNRTSNNRTNNNRTNNNRSSTNITNNNRTSNNRTSNYNNINNSNIRRNLNLNNYIAFPTNLDSFLLHVPQTGFNFFMFPNNSFNRVLKYKNHRLAISRHNNLKNLIFTINGNQKKRTFKSQPLAGNNIILMLVPRNELEMNHLRTVVKEGNPEFQHRQNTHLEQKKQLNERIKQEQLTMKEQMRKRELKKNELMSKLRKLKQKLLTPTFSKETKEREIKNIEKSLFQIEMNNFKENQIAYRRAAFLQGFTLPNNKEQFIHSKPSPKPPLNFTKHQIRKMR